MFLRSVAVVLSLTVGIYGCLEARKVTPLAPGSVDDSAENSATLSLPRTALAELGATASQLVIHVYKVENGAIGTEVRDAYKFPVTDAGLYALEGLPLGEIEFQVALMDEANQSLADGSLRAVIGTGAQTLPQLTLKPKKPTSVDVNLQIALNLVNFPDVPVVIPAEPAEVRALFKTYKCQQCHNASARPTAGLNLASYPYKNTANESVAQILTKIVDSITASNDMSLMPPSGATVKPEDVTFVKNYLQAVNDAASAGNKKWVEEVRISLGLGGPGRLETALVLKDGVYVLTDRVNLMAGSRYAYTLTAFGPGGSKLYEVVDAALDVPLNGKVELKVDVVYQAPTVTLPVVVGSGDN